MHRKFKASTPKQTLSLCVFALHTEYTSSLVHAATSVDYTQTLVSLIMEQIKKNEREESKRQEKKAGGV